MIDIQKLFPHQELPNREVLHTASQFRRAANLMFNDAQVIYLNVPISCNSALALELYLKSLNTKNVYKEDPEAIPGTCWMMYSEPNKRGHKLTEQYDELMPELRKELDELYAANLVDSKSATIRDALAVYDNLFISSRYWFGSEYPRTTTRMSLTTLIGLMNLIGEWVEKLPRWEIRKEEGPTFL